MIRICLTIATIIGATVLAFVVIVLLLNAISANGADNGPQPLVPNPSSIQRIDSYYSQMGYPNGELRTMQLRRSTY